MVERMRLFVGSTELSYNDLKLIRTDDNQLDRGSVNIVGDSDVVIGAALDIRKSDGLTSIYKPKVIKIENTQKGPWTVQFLSKGYELYTTPINAVYTSRSPEYIVENIITNYSTTLTYASSSSSGVTLTKYIARGYLIDVIRDMADVLRWKFKIDSSDNFYFEEPAFTNNGRVLHNGTEIQIFKWDEDEPSVINHVRVIGGFESILTTETITASGTTFTLSHKPAGTMRVTISGSEESPANYTVNPEDKQVVFTGSKTNPTFEYSYNRPIVVEHQDDDSITAYKDKFKELSAPWLNNLTDARKYAREIVMAYKAPALAVDARTQGFDFALDVNEIVTVIDSLRSKSRELIVTQITHSSEDNGTIFIAGSKTFDYGDRQRELQERIKKLEQRAINEDIVYISRILSHKLRVLLALSLTVTRKSPVDSFVLGHQTLGRLRSGFAFEADCSNNSAHGTWNGTDATTGARYSTSGYRLSCFDCNGSNNYMNGTGTLSGVQTINFFINPDANNKDIIKLTSSAKISLNSSNAITTTGLTNATVYVNGVAGTSAPNGSWTMVTVTCDAINANAFEVGRSSSYFDGKIDEVMVFDNKISTASMALILAKDIFDTSNALTVSGCLGYWSMDNPRLGDRFVKL